MTEININKNTLENSWDESWEIDKLFWLAIQFNSRDFSCFVEEDLFENESEKLFKLRPKDLSVMIETENIAQYLESINKLGFLALVWYPHLSNFQLDEDGKPKSWTVHGGIKTQLCVYGDSREELFANIQKENEARFQRNFELWKKERVKK